MASSYFHYRDGEKPVPDYTLIELIARGGFGEVWKARRPGGFYEALKIIDLSGQHGLKEFASLDVVKTFRHANLVPILGCWLKDDNGDIMAETVFEALSRELEAVRVTPSSPTAVAPGRPVELLIAMGLGDKSLHVVLEEYQKVGYTGIPPDELLEYMRASAKAIDFLNTGKPPIVHGDIKPHNILLVGNSAQLCDFGLCTAVQSIRVTQPTPVTVAYAAPELFSGKPTPWSDQYSLAITYVELRTGRLPFDDETLSYPYQVMDAHKRGLLRLDDLDPEVRKVIRRATSPQAEDRWPSAGKLVRELYDAEGLGSRRMDRLPPTPPPIAYDVHKGPGFDPGRYTPRDSVSETERFAPPKPAPSAPPSSSPSVRKPPERSVTPPPLPSPPPVSKSKPGATDPPPVEEFRPGQTLGRFEPVMLPADEERKTIKPLLPFESPESATEEAKLKPAPPSTPPPQPQPGPSPHDTPSSGNKTKRPKSLKQPLIPPLPDEDLIRARLLLRRRIAALAVAAVALVGIGYAVTIVFGPPPKPDPGDDKLGTNSSTSQTPSGAATTTTQIAAAVATTTSTTSTADIVRTDPGTEFAKWRDEHLPSGTTIEQKLAAIKLAKSDPRKEVFTKERIAGLEGKVLRDSLEFINARIQDFDESAEKIETSRANAMAVVGDCKALSELISNLSPDDKAEICVAQIRALSFLGFEPWPRGITADRQERFNVRKEAIAKLGELNESGASLERYRKLQATAQLLALGPADGSAQSTQVRDRLLNEFDKWPEISPLSNWEKRSVGSLRPQQVDLEDVERLIDANEFAKARAQLAERGSGFSDTDAKYAAARIALSEPLGGAAPARDAEIKAALGNLTGLLPKLHAAAQKEGATAAQKQRVGKLIAALKSFAGQNGSDPYLDLAVAAAETAAKAAPHGFLGYAESLADPRAMLASRRILRNIKGLHDTPSEELCKQVDADYAVATAQASFVPPSGVDEFWLECQIVQEKNSDSSAKLTATRERVDARKPTDPHYGYGRFVLAWDRWSRDRGSDDAGPSLEVLANLDKAYADSQSPSPGLEAESRKTRAAEILLEAVGRAYPREPILPEGAIVDEEVVGRRLAQLFQSADAAKAALVHLDLARSLSPKAASERTYRIAHALAAWYSGDSAAGQQVRAEVAQINVGRLFAEKEGPAAERRNDALALLYVGFRSAQAANPVDRTGALRFAQSLCTMCPIGWPDDERLAGVVYQQVLGPAEQIANGLLRSPQRPADLHAFYGDAGRFIDHYQYIVLKDADGSSVPRYKKIEELLNHAITDLGVRNNPDYLIRRGKARADFERQDPDDKGALADAEAAIKLINGQRNTDFVNANGLKGRALLLKSRAAECYRERTQARSDAIAALRLVTTDPALKQLATPEDLAEILIRESMVHLEQGNELVERDECQQEFHDARDAALEAKDILNQRYPEYASEALGNAYEDLASQIFEDSDQNFRRADQAFRTAQQIALKKQQQSVSQFMLERGRCNQKWFDWQLKHQSLVAPNALAATEKEARADLAFVVKNGDASQQTWAHYHSARLSQAQSNYAQADVEYAAADALSANSKDPEFAIYRLGRADSVVANFYDELGKGPVAAARRTELANSLRSRAKELAAAPPPKSLPLGLSPAIEAVLFNVLASDEIEPTPNAGLTLVRGVQIAPPPGCDLSGSQRSLLAKRVELSIRALSKEWSDKLGQELIDDCRLLLASNVVPDSRNDVDPELSKAKILKVRASSRVLPERMKLLQAAQKQQEMELALADFKAAIDKFDAGQQRHSAIRGAKPDRFWENEAAITRCFYASTALSLPTPKPTITKQALDYAKAARATFTGLGFPRGIPRENVSGLVDRLTALAAQPGP